MCVALQLRKLRPRRTRALAHLITLESNHVLQTSDAFSSPATRASTFKAVVDLLSFKNWSPF